MRNPDWPPERSCAKRTRSVRVILIEGYASMTEENQRQLKARAFRSLTVLFGGRTDSPEFEALGDVVTLEEVTR